MFFPIIIQQRKFLILYVLHSFIEAINNNPINHPFKVSNSVLFSYRNKRLKFGF